MTERDSRGEPEPARAANSSSDPEPEPDRNPNADDGADESEPSSDATRTDETTTANGNDDGEPSDRTDDADESTAADRTLGAGVVTIATDRSLESDATGETIVASLKKADHEIVTREHIGSDHDRVQAIVSRMLDRDDVDVIVTGGATSVEPSDVTIEAVEPLLEKHLTAFDELFTSLAYEVVGTQVLAARTIAGVTEGTPVFCLPGNEDAARLAMEEIILAELHGLVALAREEIPQDKWAVDADGEDLEASPDATEGEPEGDTESESEGEAETEAEVETENGGQ